MGCEKVILKNHKTSDSDVNSANKRLPLMVSDAGFGESDRVEIHHIASTQSSLGFRGETHYRRPYGFTKYKMQYILKGSYNHGVGPRHEVDLSQSAARLNQIYLSVVGYTVSHSVICHGVDRERLLVTNYSDFKSISSPS